MEKLMFYGTLAALLGSGLIAGAFFVFSVAVMPALRRLPPSEGMAAMRSINVVIQNPFFLGVFIGTAVLSIVIAGISLLNWNQSNSLYVLSAAAFYLIGSFLLTIVFNVPLNNALGAADPTNAASQEIWSDYLINWTFWNHVRTLASIFAMALFAVSLKAS